jgi:hypothetical protein
MGRTHALVAIRPNPDAGVDRLRCLPPDSKEKPW